MSEVPMQESVLSKLTIERERWGPNKGRYTGTVTFLAEKAEVTVELEPNDLEAVVAAAMDAVLIATDRATQRFKDKLLASVPRRIVERNQ